MNPSLRRSLVLIAWIGAVFCLLVTAIIFWQHAALPGGDPRAVPQLAALREKLAHDPKNASLKDEIRRVDLASRQQYRSRLALDRDGAWLLLGGGLVLVLAARQIAGMKKRPLPPRPKIDPNVAAAKRAAAARRSLAGASLIIAGSMVWIHFGFPSALPGSSEKNNLGSRVALASPPPADETPLPIEFQTNWPRFRGWDGSGVCSQTNALVSANPNQNFSVLWQTAIGEPGQSSPVVWGNRVFISGGTAERRDVFCYDTANGALLWRQSIQNVAGSPPKVSKVPEETGCASPTMATDGRRVYVIFGNGDLAALKLDGSVVWTKYLGPFKNAYGHGASLAIWENRLILQLDQGDSAPSGSKLLALQCNNGQKIWETARAVPESWATPIVVNAAGKTQIITLADPWVIAYTEADGKELWRARLLENEIVPSPIFESGLVLAPNPGAQLNALLPDGMGDVTKTHVKWSAQDNVPDIPSPAAASGLVFTVTSSGMASCFQTSDGKKIWEHDLGLEVNASPSIAYGIVFILAKNGTVVTFQASRSFHEIARAPLADSFIASPAFAGERIFLRGLTNLYGLGPTSAKLAMKPATTGRENQ